MALVFLAISRDLVLGGRLPADVVAGGDASFVGTVYEQWASQVRGGHVPLWFHEFDCGSPLAAAWMYGLLYPGMLLFALLPLGMAFAWTTALHAGIGAAGMARFLERRGCDAAGAVGGAFLFAVSEYVVGRANQGHVNLITPLAWMPWVLCFTDAAVRGERRAVPLLALVTGLGLIAGHVQVWIVLGPLVAAFALVEFAGADDRRGALRRLALGAALGVGIAAAQIAITAEFLAVSSPPIDWPAFVRACSAPPEVVAGKLLHSSLPDALAQGERIDARNEYRGIAGAWVFALAVWGCVRRAPNRTLWAVAALAGLVVAVGTRSSATAWLQDVFPFSLCRAPARFLLAPLVGVAVLAGHGIATLPVGPRARWIAAAAAAALALTFGSPPVRSVSDATHRLTTVSIPAAAQDHRAHTEGMLYLWMNVEAAGVRTLRTPCYLRTARLADFLDDATPALGWWLDVGAEFVPVTRPGAPAVPDPDDLTSVDVRTRPAMGGARFFGATTTGVDDATALRRLRAGERTLFLAGTSADADDAGDENATSPAPAGTARVAAWSPGEIRIEARCEGPGWILVSSQHYAGWTCELDGKTVPVVRANVAFPAIRVPAAGDHVVVLRYEPWSFRISAAISAIALAVTCVLLVRARRDA